LIRGSPRVKSVLLLSGAPNDGKTSLLGWLSVVLGERAVQMAATTMHTVGTRPMVDGFSTASDLARLDGARVAVFDEMPGDRDGEDEVTIREDIVKRLVGSMTVSGRRIGHGTVSAPWVGNVVAATNDEGPWRRLPRDTRAKVSVLRMLPPPRELDGTLRARLLGDPAGGILRLLPALGRVPEVPDLPMWRVPHRAVTSRRRP
jgi:hypothetical protein